MGGCKNVWGFAPLKNGFCTPGGFPKKKNMFGGECLGTCDMEGWGLILRLNCVRLGRGGGWN